MSDPISIMLMALASIAAATGVFGLVSAVTAFDDRRLRRRIDRLAEQHADDASQGGYDALPGLFARLLRYARRLLRMGLFARLVDRLATPDRLYGFERRLEQAGLDDEVTPREYLAVKVLAAGGMLLIGLVLNAPLIALVMTAIGYRLSDMSITNQIEDHQRSIRISLPRATDILVVAVQAGLTFDKAIELYCQQFRGPLVEEFKKFQTDISVGRRRREALQDMATRVDVDELNLIVNSVLQAERFGVPVAVVLRSLSAELKTRREQYIREMSAKAPVKMLIPVVFLIMPAMFAVLLGPAAVNMMSGGLF